MATLSSDRLRAIAAALLEAVGTPAEAAKAVAGHLVEANLAGHDSHGVMRLRDYVNQIRRKKVFPDAPWEILDESDTTLAVDGHFGLGHVVMRRAMQAAIEKARRCNVAAATVRNQGHIGRLASYPIMAADAGMIGIVLAGAGPSSRGVAPYGGQDGRLSTNPLAIAVPSDTEGPLYIDMATSAASWGKIRLAESMGKSIPQGWLVDGDGQPTTDPADLRRGGMLLPLGGAEGYKGYGLSVMVDILTNILTGAGFVPDPSRYHGDTCFIAVFKVEAFMPLPMFRQQVAAFAGFLKSSRPAGDGADVLYPGENSARKSRRRKRDGIEVDAETWSNLQELAREYGLDDVLGLVAARTAIDEPQAS
jgi:uncharacterized oxidoreductase